MVSEKTIIDLINNDSDLSITITLPTHKAGEESKQDPIRFKNLISNVEEQLTKKGKKNGEIEKILKPAKELLDKPLFWSHMDHGLVVYMTENSFDVYKLPYTIDEQAFVNDHFLITPLLPMTSMEGTYTVLAVSRQKLRLLRCTRNDVTDITPDNIPLSVADYLEVEPEKELQFHTGAKGEAAMFFGHNANEEDKKVIVEQFYREADKDITPLMNSQKDPLVLIGLKDNIHIYNKANNYGRVVDDVVARNPDELTDKQLKDFGWEVIKDYFLKDMYNSLENYSKQPNEKVSNNLSEIIEATVMGKSQIIFLSKGEKKWGLYDEDNHTVHYTNSEDDSVELLNWLSITGFKRGSKVYMLPKEEMPIRSTVAAEFRF